MQNRFLCAILSVSVNDLARNGSGFTQEDAKMKVWLKYCSVRKDKCKSVFVFCVSAMFFIFPGWGLHVVVVSPSFDKLVLSALIVGRYDVSSYSPT